MILISFRRFATLFGLYMNPPDKAIVLSVDEKTRYRLWTARSPFFLCGLACRSGGRMTTNATERLPYSPL